MTAQSLRLPGEGHGTRRAGKGQERGDRNILIVVTAPWWATERPEQPPIDDESPLAITAALASSPCATSHQGRGVVFKCCVLTLCRRPAPVTGTGSQRSHTLTPLPEACIAVTVSSSRLHPPCTQATCYPKLICTAGESRAQRGVLRDDTGCSQH
jgi:hypothetical protein